MSNLLSDRRLIGLSLAALLVFVAAQAASGWRYFPGFLGDHGWYLQVAWRASQGEVLYRDVAWAYGPLPAQALAALFRWLGPNAGLASWINSLLTVLSILLTYVAVRSLLSSPAALLLTAFATVAGPYVWGDLFHSHFYVYTQAVAWGSVASLAALVCSLAWQRDRRHVWLMLAGLASGLAVLSKPEFGLTALGSCGAIVAAGRGRRRAWASLLIAWLAVAAGGLAWQASSAGWQPVWRGYAGYDQLGQRSLWGASLGDLPRLLEFYGLWIAAAAIWGARRWPRWRALAYPVAAIAGLAALSLLLSDMAADGRTALLTGLRQGAWRELHWAPANLLVLLVAAPWAPLFWLLLAAGWLGHRRQTPPAWWGLWAFALLSNLRLVLTGFASGLAAAPALAVLWWLLADRWREGTSRRRRYERLALAGLATLTLVNIAGQLIASSAFFNGPRATLSTELGAVRVPQTDGLEAAALQAAVERLVPPGAPIFGVGWAGQWYLLTRRPNPTAFDVVLAGMGASGLELPTLQRSLAANPVAAIFVPARQPIGEKMAALGLAGWWNTAAQNYADRTPPDVRDWRLLVRQGP